MDKINLLVKTLLIAALSVPIVAVTVISNSNSIANASTNTTETPSSLLLSNSSLPSASLVNETVTSSNNNSFVYASPTVQFKSLLNGVDSHAIQFHYIIWYTILLPYAMAFR